MADIVPVELIASKILIVRGKNVMLDKDLADLYGVATKNLNKAVSRNKERFPEDFMFQLTKEELANLRFQFGTSKGGGIRYLPYVFTEQGVAMLSSVLRSKMAIQVNIQIMRAFTQLRRMLLTNRGLRRKIEEMEKKYDKQFVIVFQAIKQLLEPPVKEKEEVVAICDHLSALKFSHQLPCVFTEQGVAMLSSVLNSGRAIKVNILIMRAFVKLSDILSRNKELSFKLKELEERIEGHDTDIRDIFEAIRQLMRIPDERQRITGFATE